MEQRTLAVLLHPERDEALLAATEFIAQMHSAGFRVLLFPDDLARVSAQVPQAELAPLGTEPAELAVVFGGDGTILRAAEWAHRLVVPLLGVNLGHVGFLAELETSDIDALCQAVIERAWQVEERLVIQTQLSQGQAEPHWQSFAINEVSLERLAREKMLNVLVSIDSRPLSRWGCDGVLVATPTGSTAYAFSANGPVIWPDVQALLVVPLSAHALFNRPLVLSPASQVQIDLTEQTTPGTIWCDGRRSTEVQPGDVVKIKADPQPLYIARLSEQPFTTRLVKKFALPVDGWRRSPSNPSPSNAD